LTHQAEIEDEFQKMWSNGAEFVSAGLGPDTDANLRGRRKGLFTLMAKNCLARPMNAARAVSLWLYRKGNAYCCPTVPVIGIDTGMESSALRDCLLEKLGCVFQRIIVTDRPMGWQIRRSMQNRQNLLVFRRDGRRENQREIDKWISIPASNREAIDAGVAAILDCVVQYNDSWSALYLARSAQDNNRPASDTVRC
jgi:hypothetical protein